MKGGKPCKIGEYTLRVACVKSGFEAGAKHVDTQIVFFINREKVTCHFYNITLIILVNGHVHLKLENLGPYFHSKIDLNLAEINHLNENTLEALGGKKVRHGSVRYKGGSTFLCNSCDFAAKTMVALAKHNRNEHALSFTTKFAVFSSPFPKH